MNFENFSSDSAAEQRAAAENLARRKQELASRQRTATGNSFALGRSPSMPEARPRLSVPAPSGERAVSMDLSAGLGELELNTAGRRFDAEYEEFLRAEQRKEEQTATAQRERMAAKQRAQAEDKAYEEAEEERVIRGIIERERANPVHLSERMREDTTNRKLATYYSERSRGKDRRSINVDAWRMPEQAALEKAAEARTWIRSIDEKREAERQQRIALNKADQQRLQNVFNEFDQEGPNGLKDRYEIPDFDLGGFTKRPDGSAPKSKDRFGLGESNEPFNRQAREQQAAAFDAAEANPRTRQQEASSRYSLSGDALDQSEEIAGTNKHIMVGPARRIHPLNESRTQYELRHGFLDLNPQKHPRQDVTRASFDPSEETRDAYDRRIKKTRLPKQAVSPDMSPTPDWLSAPKRATSPEAAFDDLLGDIGRARTPDTSPEARGRQTVSMDAIRRADESPDIRDARERAVDLRQQLTEYERTLDKERQNFQEAYGQDLDQVAVMKVREGAGRFFKRLFKGIAKNAAGEKMKAREDFINDFNALNAKALEISAQLKEVESQVPREGDTRMHGPSGREPMKRGVTTLENRVTGTGQREAYRAGREAGSAESQENRSSGFGQALDSQEKGWFNDGAFENGWRQKMSDSTEMRQRAAAYEAKNSLPKRLGGR